MTGASSGAWKEARSSLSRASTCRSSRSGFTDTARGYCSCAASAKWRGFRGSEPAHKKGGVDLSAFHATQGRRIVTPEIHPPFPGVHPSHEIFAIFGGGADAA